MIYKLPQKDKWLIVGCGCSASKADKFIDESVGVITLNYAFQHFKHIDVAFHNHYEALILNIPTFGKSDINLINETLGVGINGSCFEKSVYDLITPKFFQDDKIIVYRASSDDKMINYGEHFWSSVTVGGMAVSLLYQNGIKEFWSAGVGEDILDNMQENYDYKVCPWPEGLRDNWKGGDYNSIKDNLQWKVDEWRMIWHKL